MTLQTGRNYRMKEGQVGGVLMTENPAEERRLAQKLHKLEVEKRRCSAILSWNQRSFFMRQVFDEDNDLRFVKAQERPKYFGGFLSDDTEEMHTLQRKQTQLRRNEHGHESSLYHVDWFQENKIKLTDNINHASVDLPNPVVKMNESSGTSGENSTLKTSNCNLKSTETSLKPRTRFPVVKIKALGLFAASAKKASLKNVKKQPTSLYEVNMPIICNSGLEIADLSNIQTIEKQPILIREPSQSSLYSIYGHKSEKSSQTLKLSSLTEKQLEGKMKKDTLNGRINGSGLVKSAKPTKYIPGERKNIWMKVSELTETHLKNCKEHRLAIPAKEKETCDDFDDLVIRRLVRTLPTSLLLKTHRREAEAGGQSTHNMQLVLLDQTRKKMTSRTIHDARFKNLEKTLGKGL